MTTLCKPLLAIAITASLGLSSMAMAASTNDCGTYYDNGSFDIEDSANGDAYDQLMAACYNEDTANNTPQSTLDSITLAHNHFISDFYNTCPTCNTPPDSSWVKPQFNRRSATMQDTNPNNTHQPQTSTNPRASLFPAPPSATQFQNNQSATQPTNQTTSTPTTTTKVKWF